VADLLKPDILSTFLFYIAPGVVATAIYTFFNRSEKRNYGDLAVEFITFGIFYLTLFFWLIDLVNRPDIHSNALLYNILVLITFFVIPAIFGCLASIIPKTQWFRRLLKRTYHPTPTAWGHIFGDKKISYWVLCTLKTGQKIGGVYKDKSFASSFPQTQDLLFWAMSKNSQYLVLISMLR
jgi:hypothetical protein